MRMGWSVRCAATPRLDVGPPGAAASGRPWLRVGWRGSSCRVWSGIAPWQCVRCDVVWCGVVWCRQVCGLVCGRVCGLGCGLGCCLEQVGVCGFRVQMWERRGAWRLARQRRRDRHRPSQRPRAAQGFWGQPFNQGGCADGWGAAAGWNGGAIPGMGGKDPRRALRARARFSRAARCLRGCLHKPCIALAVARLVGRCRSGRSGVERHPKPQCRDCCASSLPTPPWRDHFHVTMPHASLAGSAADSHHHGASFRCRRASVSRPIARGLAAQFAGPPARGPSVGPACASRSAQMLRPRQRRPVALGPPPASGYAGRRPATRAPHQAHNRSGQEGMKRVCRRGRAVAAAASRLSVALSAACPADP